MIQQSDASVAVFLSRGGSLEKWNSHGLLSRELALYEALSRIGVEVTLVSFGRGDERRYLGSSSSLSLASNHYGIHPRLYEWLIPILHRRRINNCAVIKTNQANVGRIVCQSARILKKPIIARCGYLWSEFAAREYGRNSSEARRAVSTERLLFDKARRIVVSTETIKSNIEREYPAFSDKISVVPNYVDTERFYPRSGGDECRDILFVGRIASQKNLPILLDAMRRCEQHLTVIGSGPDETELRNCYGDLGDRVTWIGNVPNEKLPDYMNSARFFVLPSLYEGHPKALMEAMACGMVVIAADSPGIHDLLEHRQTGWLCTPTADGILEALGELCSDAKLAAKLRENAANVIRERFSLNSVAARERTILEEIGSTLGART